MATFKVVISKFNFENYLKERKCILVKANKSYGAVHYLFSIETL